MVSANGAAEPEHQVVWRFLGNDTPSPGECAAELTIDLADAPEDASIESWLYFNFGRKPAEASDGDAATSYEHVNGDLFRLRLTSADFTGTPRTIRLRSRGAVLNVTDTPSGFFLVTRRSDASERVAAVFAEIDLSVLSSATGPVTHETGRALGPTQSDKRSGDGLEVPVIPQPRKYVPGSGLLPLSGLSIVCEESLRRDAERLADVITSSGGDRPEILASLPGGEPAIRLMLGEPGVPGVNPSRRSESYRLEIDAEAGVNLVSASAAGLHHGVETLAALITNTCHQGTEVAQPAVREAVVFDAPHFVYRGLHLDVARNFQSASTVSKLLGLMSAYKLNRFHFHLTDDEGWRLEIRGLPELTKVGGQRGYPYATGERLPPSFGSGHDPSNRQGSGYYTRGEFVELLREAAERNIEVIPEIDLPGHARAAIQSMHRRYTRLLENGDAAEAERYLLRRPDDGAQYESVQMWDDNVVDVRLESTYAFIEHVVADLASMFNEAGVSLRTLHIGGDEVPDGSWGEQSREEKHRLFASFVDRFAKIARSHGVRISGWEEVFLGPDHREPRRDGGAAEGLCYAWNNIIGWGQEDAAYRLANAGIDVVLCNATHLYFDLAYSREAEEPGYYWAGVTDTEEVFRFRPYNLFDGLTNGRTGRPIAAGDLGAFEGLTPEGRAHVVGLQGHLWGETLVSAERLERMAFPRLLALAERAWSGPHAVPEDQSDAIDVRRGWREFASHVGTRELQRLDQMRGGVAYRVPSVHVASAGDVVLAEAEFPGVAVRYTTDGTDPTPSSALLAAPLPASSEYRLRCFDGRDRGGAVTAWPLPAQKPR